MKAVAILDMPSCCGVCKFRNAAFCWCALGTFSLSNSDLGDRHRDCPLKVLPLKMSAPTYREYDAYVAAANFIGGWNACIDRLVSEEK